MAELAIDQSGKKGYPVTKVLKKQKQLFDFYRTRIIFTQKG
ncbi:hypothetical protein [Acetobacterium sp.]|nr:hypothetical protein [Acetobacterium sp.]MDO9493010.1 hypothetical protein [Acetobacterium sp.]